MPTIAEASVTKSISRVLVTSPDPQFRSKMCERLESDSTRVEESSGGADTLARWGEIDCRAVLLDKRLTDIRADEVAELLQKQRPGVQIVFVDSAEELGATGNCGVPAEFDSERDFFTWRDIRRDSESFRVTAGSRRTAHETEIEPLPGMIGAHRSMQQVFRMARLVARRNTTVLITGETGTGKELVASAIHEISPRRNGPFVVVNCAAIPETLLEAELFGHVRGAFTGAIQSRLGRIHSAHGGTLFLDEAGDLPLSMQSKLLRFLQHGEVQRLGSPDVFRVDVRVIAATNVDLRARVAEKLFRRDLYYRLAVFPIQLPNLALRREDIVPLAGMFLEKLSLESRIGPKTLTPGAEALLQRHSWPGNVRELEHVVERAFILAEERDQLSAEQFQVALDEPSL